MAVHFGHHCHSDCRTSTSNVSIVYIYTNNSTAVSWTVFFFSFFKSNISRPLKNRYKLSNPSEDLIGSYFLLPGCIFSKKLWPQKTSADWPHMSEWKGLRWECGRTEVSEQCAQYVCDCVCCLWRLFVCLVDFPSHSNTMDRITVITDSWVCLCFQLRLTFIPHAAKKVCF